MKEKNHKTLEAKAWASDVINGIYDDTRDYIRCKESHPIADLKELLVYTARRYPNNVAYLQKWKSGGEYEPITYSYVLDDVNYYGTAMLALGLKDKKVAVIGRNCYQWCITYLAVTGGVGCIVPLDRELNAEELKIQINKAGVACVAFDERHRDIFVKMLEDGDTTLECAIAYDPADEKLGKKVDNVYDMLSLIEDGRKRIEGGDKSYVNAKINNEEMSVLLFTSGTTGKPKAVMLSQKNICSLLMTMPTVFFMEPEDRLLSFLSIHHTFECTCGFLLPIYKGASVAFCEGMRYIARNMREVKPTILIGVPYFFEKMNDSIWKNIRNKGREKTVKRGVFVNKLAHRFGVDLGNKMLKEIKDAFGGNVHTIACGGAEVKQEILDGLQDVGFTAIQGYGLTETSPVVSINPPYALKPGSVGVVLPCQRIQIHNPDKEGIGEICVKGDNVMLGYYEDPKATAEVIDSDGWFHTGDLGYLDSDGYLFITGRAKNVIVTRKGKNVYPEVVEQQLNNVDFIEESFVYEEESLDNANTVIAATVKLDRRAVISRLGEDFTDDDLRKLVWTEIEKINSKAPAYRRVHKVKIRKRDFVHNTSLKLVRNDLTNRDE